MQLTIEHALLILGMCLVTFLPRFLPLVLLSSRSLNPVIERWLRLVPPAVLAALLVPELLVVGKGSGSAALHIGLDNTMLLASIPSFLVAWFSGSFFGTIVTGMAAAALLRLLAGL